MVLVGLPGSGKSTALRSIAGLEEITGGTISIGSRVVNDLPPKDRDIAMVGQSYVLYPRMTVEENLCVRPQAPQHPPGRDQAAGHRGRADARPGALPVPPPGHPVRRSAAAGRDGPGDRPRAAGVPDGRAAVQPGRDAPGVHARRPGLVARAARHHHRVRDPRPGRGDDPGRPGLRAARRPDPAGGHPAAGARVAGQPVRGPLHRLPRDELRGGRARARRRPLRHLRRAAAAGARSAARRPAGPGPVLRADGHPGRPAVGL